MLNIAEFAESRENKIKFQHLEMNDMPKFTEKHRILVIIVCIVQNLQNSLKFGIRQITQNVSFLGKHCSFQNR